MMSHGILGWNQQVKDGVSHSGGGFLRILVMRLEIPPMISV